MWNRGIWLYANFKKLDDNIRHLRIYVFQTLAFKNPRMVGTSTFYTSSRLSVLWLLWTISDVTQFSLTYLQQSQGNYRLKERQDDQWITNWQGFRNKVFRFNFRHCPEICLKKLGEANKTRKYSGFPDKDLNPGRPHGKAQMQVLHLRHSRKQIQEYWARWWFMAI